MKTWQKTIAVIATFALLTNSLAAPFTILAQEVTPTPEATSTPEATIAPTSEPSASPTTTPVDLVTPTPEVTPTAEPSFTPIPSDQPIQTQAPESNPTTQGPPEQTNSSIPSATPTATPEASVENGELLVTILENTKATSVEQVLEGFDLNYEQTETSATLITDKADYAPTDSVLITGTGFTPNETYKLVITSEDEPKVNFENQVIANDKGEIIYIYQLDGNYRPNYKVQAFDLSEVLIATVTFTDSESSSATLPFSDSFGSSDVDNVTNWEDSDGNGGNTYIEGTSSSRPGSPTTGHVRLGANGWVCRTINAIGYQSLQLGYYWRGDDDAQGNDDAFIEYKTSGNCNDGSGWTQIAQQNINQNTSAWTSQVTHNLSSSLNNTTFKLRFRSNAGDNNQQFRFDDVSITGSVANTPPIITEGASTSVTMSVNGSPTPFSLTLNATDSDLPAQTLTWSISSNASHGTASVSGTGSSKSISYTPTTNYIGTDSFNVRVSDGNGGTDTITVNVTINPYIVSNPGLAQSCGIDVALVVDTSTSIDNTELGQMKTALKGFINTLIGTPTRMAVVSFDDVAKIESNFTDDLSSLSVTNGVIDNIDGDGYTNWEDAIQDTRALFPDRTDKPDLIIFTSDGNPTASNTGGANDTSQPNSHLAPAITQANSAKGDGIRIITLGIGSDVDANRLKQISSDDAYYSAANFSSLATTLEELVTDLCGGTVTVNKQVDSDGDGGYEGGNTEANTLDFNWNIDSETLNRNMGTTLDDVEAGNHTISESSVSGYTFTGWYYSNDTEYSCTNPRGTTLPINITTTDNSITSITLCNAQQNGHLVVQKTTIPAGDATEFSITATGSGTITGGGSGTVTDSQDKTYEVTPGTYSVSESALSGWKETGNTCTSITVSAGETEYCTITNTKLGSISGYKYEDQDGNIGSTGDQTAVPDWVISLYKWVRHHWKFITSTTTDENGFYSFGNLLPGLYKVIEGTEPGWINLTNTRQKVWLSAGENEGGKNFVNTQYGSTTIIKFNDLNQNGVHDENEPFLSDWEMTMTDSNGAVLSQMTGLDGSATFSNLKPGNYEFNETVQEGWQQTGIYCEATGPGVLITSPGEGYGCHGNCDYSWNQCDDAATCALWACNINGYSNLISYGEGKPCTQLNNCHLFNYTPDSIQWNWGNWCNVMGVTDIYCSNGGPGGSPASKGSQVTISSGQNRTCYIGNFEEEPSVEITKTNNSTSSINPGSSAVYTVTLENTGNVNVTGAQITDILPGGFSYVPGSTTGDTTNDPSISGSILTWNIGNLGAGESFTIHYEVVTSSDLSDGIYTNFADCRAFTRSQKEIFCDPAASSTVRIGSSTGYSGSLGGQVLGASTELPATGSPTWVLIGSLTTLASGLFLNIYSKRGRRTYGKK